jgi:integrase
VVRRGGFPTSEILPLTWEQVDFDTGTVRLLSGTAKNKEGRVLFLTPELKAILEQQRSEHLTHYRGCSLVFHRDGKHIKDMRGSWERACRESGFSGKIPHDLRRTAVRNMVRADISEHVAMRLSGHKTRDVFDRYDIVSEGDLKEDAQKLSRRLSGQTGTETVTVGGAPLPESALSH